MSEPARDTEPAPGGISGFEIEQEIARGGMATVYLANQLSLDRKVALKTLHAFNDPTHKTRFLNESRIIGSLNHRNVITIYDVGVEGGCVYLAMEYLDGGDLASKIEKGPIDCCEALEIAAAVGDCLASVHQQGVVHRDVKPANVLFHGDGTPILTDFGIATDVRIDAKLTACGTTIGSPCYISPEQAGGHPTDGRTDIYSLGVVLYEMLVGRPPFQEDSAVETMAAHLSTPPPRLPDHLSACQPLLNRMLAKDARDRFASAADMVEAVRDLQILVAGEAANPRAAATRPLMALVSDTFAGLRRVAEGFWRTTKEIPNVAAVVALLVLVPLGLSAFDWLMEPEEVTKSLRLAEQAVDDERFFQPRSNSALYHYRKVLTLDPGNDDAADGLHEIAETYADRAEDDLLNRQFSSAKHHVDNGLRAEPGNRRLLELQEDTRSLRSLPEKVVRGIKSIFD